VPYLYGSGVIPDRCWEIPASPIKQLMMQQFFTANNIEQLLKQRKVAGQQDVESWNLFECSRLWKIYEGLVFSIMGSSFGGMLVEWWAAKKPIGSLKEPFTEKMKITLVDMDWVWPL